MLDEDEGKKGSEGTETGDETAGEETQGGAEGTDETAGGTEEEGATEGKDGEENAENLDDLTDEERAALEAEGADNGSGEGESKADDLTPEELAILEKANPKFHKRITALANKVKELEGKVPDKGTGDGKKPLKDFTEDELIALEEQQPAYKKYVRQELTRREVAKQLEENSSKSEFNKVYVDSQKKALLKYPDLANTESQFYKVAATIYKERGYGNIADGSLVAADRAAEILRKSGKKFQQGDAKRKTAVKKFGLTGAQKGTAGAGAGSNSKLLALEEKALSTAPGSPEWAAVRKEVRRLESLKKKAQ